MRKDIQQPFVRKEDKHPIQMQKEPSIRAKGLAKTVGGTKDRARDGTKDPKEKGKEEKEAKASTLWNQ